MAMLLVDELVAFARERGIARWSDLASIAGVDPARLKLGIQGRPDLTPAEFRGLADAVHCRVAELVGPAHISEGLTETFLSLSPLKS